MREILNMIGEVLLFFKIVEKCSNIERDKQKLKRLGKGYNDAYRFNPCNPLSYILLAIYLPVKIIIFGLVGIFDFENPFKWS